MADELGATVIIVKEISIPALMIDQAGLRVQQRIDGGARLPRKRLDDVSEGEGGMPGVVTDTDTSEAEDFVSSVITPVDSGIDLALLTSSTPPRPIIRTYPYGNTPYMNRGSAGLRIVQPCSIPSAAITTDFDDDPAFAFDLDISTFPVKPTANDIVVPAIPVVPVPVARGPKDKGFVKTQKRYNTPKPPAPTRTGGFKSAKPITPTPTAVVVPVPVVNNLIPISVLKDEDEHTGDLRLIVEALVVRKLSVEEAFLDFGGFTLE